jgi:hypothetical protein
VLYFSASVRNKLKTKHQVTEAQVLQCFANREGQYLIDDREEHRTVPPTQWFVASTDYGLILKVMFVFDPASKLIEVKSAYRATPEVQRIYKKYAAF